MNEELPNFSEPIVLSDDDQEEESEEDEPRDIPDQMQFDDPNGVLDYEEFKEFWGDEIDGKMNRRNEQKELEKTKKKQAMGEEDIEEPDEDEKKEGEGEEGEGEGEENQESEEEKKRRELEERLAKEKEEQSKKAANIAKQERETLKNQKFLQLLDKRRTHLPDCCT